MSPKSGVQDDGRFVPVFEGQRPPFEHGNELARQHGGYVGKLHLLRLQPRIQELADNLRKMMPTEGFDAAVEAAAIAGVRLEAASHALTICTDAQRPRLEREEARWWRNWMLSLGKLGLTPESASRMGLNIALAQNAQQQALERHLEANYGRE